MDRKTIDTYNRTALAYDEETTGFWNLFPRTIIDKFAGLTHGRVLDVGSGPGRDGLILKNKGQGMELFLSSVTDPYQGAEGEYKLTRQCLQILADYGFAGVVSILTKSNLVIRDIDIFKKLKHVIVGLTVTSTDDTISRYFEKNAPASSTRLKTLKILNNNGIKTYAFIGPLLPHFVAQGEELEKLIVALSKTGTKDIFIEHLNLAKYIRQRLLAEMKGIDPDIMEKFYSSQSKDYRLELEEKIRNLIKKYKMNLLLNMIIFHKEFKERHSNGQKNLKPF